MFEDQSFPSPEKQSTEPVFDLEDYRVKQEVYKDLSEKIERLQFIKSEKLNEYKFVFQELNSMRIKKRSLFKLRYTTSRCIFFEKTLRKKISEIHSSFFTDLSSKAEDNQNVKISLEALFFLLKGQQYSWPEIVSFLEPSQLVSDILNFQKDEVPEDKIAFMKENYMQLDVLKQDNFDDPIDNFHIRLIIEWMISRVLFNNYNTQLLEIDLMIKRLNDEKFQLENEEISQRNLIADIVSQIDSLSIRCQELKEDVQFEMSEEMARCSIQNHVRTGISGDYDISEILTRRQTDHTPSPPLIPRMIQICTEDDDKFFETPANVSNLTKTFNEEVKFQVESSSQNDDVNLSKIIEFVELKEEPKYERHKSMSSTFHQKLNDELQQIKQNLIDESKSKRNQSQDKKQTNLDEFYLNLLGVKPDECDIKTSEVGDSKFKKDYNHLEFEQIDSPDFSDNQSEHKQTKCSSPSVKYMKNTLFETGFSKFDVMIGQNGLNKSQGQFKLHDDSPYTRPTKYNDFQVSTISYMNKNLASSNEIIAKDELLRRIDEQIRNDTETMDKYLPIATNMKEDSQGNVSMSIAGRRRPDWGTGSVFKSEIFQKPKVDNLMGHFTSFRLGFGRNSNKDEEARSEQGNISFAESNRKKQSRVDMGNFETFRGVAEKQTFEYPEIIDRYMQSNLKMFLDKYYSVRKQKVLQPQISISTNKRNYRCLEKSYFKVFENKKIMNTGSRRTMSTDVKFEPLKPIYADRPLQEINRPTNMPMFQNCNFITINSTTHTGPIYSPPLTRNPFKQNGFQQNNTDFKFKNVIFQNADQGYFKKGVSMNPNFNARGSDNELHKSAFLKSKNRNPNLNYNNNHRPDIFLDEKSIPETKEESLDSSFTMFDKSPKNSDSMLIKTFKNSFNEKSRDIQEFKTENLEKSMPDLINAKTQHLKESLFSALGEKSHPVMNLNGKEICLVRVDNNVNVYRYKEDIHK